MASRHLKRAAESPTTPRPSNFRRMSVGDSSEELASNMAAVQEEDIGMHTPLAQSGAQKETEGEAHMPSDGQPPATPEQEEDDSMMLQTPDTDMFGTPVEQGSSAAVNDMFSTPVHQASAAQAPKKGLSTLRRKTEQMFLSSKYSSDPFDPDDDEYDQGSPSLHSKELKQKANSIFTSYREPKNVLSSDADMDSSPIQTLRGRATKSINSPPNRRPKATADYTSSPVRMEVDEGFEAESSIRKNSAALFGEKNFSSNNIWDADDEEFALNLGDMRLDDFGRVRSSASRSMRAPLGSFKLNRPQGEQTVGGIQDGGPVKNHLKAVSAAIDGRPDKQDLETAVHSFVEHRGTFKGIPHIKSHRYEAKQDVSKSSAPIRGENLTDQQKDDYMHELADKNCGNLRGIDAHDEVMKQYYKASHRALPVSSPSNMPHLIDHKAWNDDEDSLVRCARPRLADAVATVLFQTSPKCMDDFLNPEVQTFEWRREGNCIMIRREGNEVIVGTFSNFGTTYLWPLFVRSRIDDAGAWEEIYAGAAMIKTAVTAEGVQFDQAVEEGERIDNVDPKNEKYALHMGRVLGKFLLEWTVWDFRQWRRWGVFWEADGVVVDAKEHGNEALKMLRDLE